MNSFLNPLLNPDLAPSLYPESDNDAEVQQYPEGRARDEGKNEAVIGSLNHLIQVLHDGQEMYLHAAEHVKSNWLRSLFEGYSSQREQFATELANLVAGLGVMPDPGSTVGAVLHQAWVDLKAAVVGVSVDDAAVLDECERGEDAAKQAYETELNKGLPDHIHQVVQSQYQDVLQAHNQVRELRDEFPR